ncbi:MAG: hemerythrin domain-containing protein [Acidimicrobiales bacterium]
MARNDTTKLPEFVAHAATTPPDNPDLLERLSFEHSQIRRLWSELQLGHRRRLETENLARKIVTALAEHDALELQMLYPAVERVIGEELAHHATADHEEIRQLLDEVDGEDPTDELVYEAFETMMAKVMAHIEEEERIAFPMLRAILSSQELRDLGEPPHTADPSGPEGEVIDLAEAERQQDEAASSPNAGLADRGRRLLRRR